MSHRIGAAGPTVPPRGPLSAVPPRSSDPTCPPWCRADHAADMQGRQEVAEAVVRQLAAEGLYRSPMVETYLLHQVEVGWMSVRVGQDEPLGMLRVTVEQIEDVDGSAWSTGLLVRIEEPPNWTEEYSPGEARELAALLVRAGQVTQA